jgi:hypothetical protein
VQWTPALFNAPQSLDKPAGGSDGFTMGAETRRIISRILARIGQEKAGNKKGHFMMFFPEMPFADV